MIARGLGMAAMGVLLLAGSPAEAAFKQVRDTSVLCDFAQNCTLTLRGGEGAPGLSLHRGAQAGAKPVLRLFYGEDARPTGRLELLVDGKSVATVASAALKPQGDALQYDDADGVARLIEAARLGKALELKQGGRTASYSLSGFVGGLIYLDEQQARDGTTDALQARGDKAPPPSPDVTMIETKEQIPQQIRGDFTGDAAVCGGSSASLFRAAGGFEAKITDDLTLIGLPCGSPGAYNQPYAFYSRSEDKIVPISLPTMSDDGPTVTDAAWNIDWSQKAKTLTAFFKGRGLGDCGTYDVWKATDNGEGRVRFVLVEERSKGDCDGNYAGGPQKWPTDWPVARR